MCLFKKTKIFVFVISIFILLFLVLNSLSPDVDKITEKRNLSYDLVDSIFINKMQVVFDKEKNICYISNSDFIKNSKININSLNSNVKSYVFNDNGSYKIIVYSSSLYQIVDVVITNAPILSIYDLNLPYRKDLQIFNSNSIKELDDESMDLRIVGVQFFNNSLSSRLFFSDTASMSVRGSSSLMYGKIAYKLKFNDKINFFNEYKEDTWVLDALYTDKSKIRNKLSSDIWNLVNDNQEINNDLYGDFIEVFINDSYEGLYVLKNKVNKSITGIDDNGLLLKSIIHLQDYYINKLVTNSFIVKENSFLNYEIKHYNHDSFNSFISKFQNFYRNYYDEITSDIIDNSFDFSNFINYKIFVCLIGGNDNLTYNQYLSLKNPDSKILITPWDMDLTWGLNWSDDGDLHSIFSMESSSDINWMNENITKNMDVQTLSLLKHRYWELRKDVITMDTINYYLNSYKELLVDSGAASRDSERWYEYDVEFEIEQIREWASRRIQFLDEYFK